MNALENTDQEIEMVAAVLLKMNKKKQAEGLSSTNLANKSASSAWWKNRR